MRHGVSLLFRHVIVAAACWLWWIPRCATAQEVGRATEEKTVWSQRMAPVLERAGENRQQLERAWRESPPEHREAMAFLIANMPDRDATSLTAEYLLENVRLAYEAWEAAPWKDEVPREIFLNYVLPYASINERRDDWRRLFREKFGGLVEDVRSPAQAAARLNQNIFSLVHVRYSTRRPKADQSPLESIQAGTASCTGLSVLLIDACRAVGVPARFVGTPLWADGSGNHSWVEVWDHGWHYTGAAEPTGDALDRAWFTDRASAAQRDDPLRAIYAASFQRTPLRFPLVWDRSVDYISAVNVTDRYTRRAEEPPAGMVRLRFCVLDEATGERCAARLTIKNAAGAIVFEGTCKDERFDANDHLTALLPQDQSLQAELHFQGRSRQLRFQSTPREKPWIWKLQPE